MGNNNSNALADEVATVSRLSMESGWQGWHRWAHGWERMDRKDACIDAHMGVGGLVGVRDRQGKTSTANTGRVHARSAVTRSPSPVAPCSDPAGHCDDRTTAAACSVFWGATQCRDGLEECCEERKFCFHERGLVFEGPHNIWREQVGGRCIMLGKAGYSEGADLGLNWACMKKNKRAVRRKANEDNERELYQATESGRCRVWPTGGGIHGCYHTEEEEK